MITDYSLMWSMLVIENISSIILLAASVYFLIKTKSISGVLMVSGLTVSIFLLYYILSIPIKFTSRHV